MINYCPPAKEGGERVVVLWFRKSNKFARPKNNHPCRLRRLPLLRPPVLATEGKQEGSFKYFI